MSTKEKASSFTGSISPLTTLIVLACVGGLIFLTYVGKVNGDAAIAIIGGIIGAVLRGSGAADANKAANPPPAG